MTRVRLLAQPLLLPLLAAAGVALGQADPCRGPTTAELRLCTAQRLDAAEKEMERYFVAARRVARPASALEGSQAAWLQYEYQACRSAAGQYEGGSLQPVVFLDCRLRLTRERTLELWRAFLAEQGDLPEPRLTQ